MKNILILWVFILTTFLYAEKWIGQVATYQPEDGTKTYSGEIFNKDALTAACNAFKIGAKVEVLNPKNGKVVEVTINDRIDSNSNYFILLTPRAAKELELEWETSLIVVKADFSAISSNDSFPINGILEEDKFFENKLPYLDWQDEEINKKLELENSQKEEEKSQTFDALDDKSPVTQDVTQEPKENIREKTEEKSESSLSDKLNPVEITKENNEAIASKTLKPYEIVKEQENKEATASNKLKPYEIIKQTDNKDATVSDKLKPIESTKKDDKKEPQQKNITPPEEKKFSFDDIKWVDKLDKDKLYIKIFSSSLKEDFANKYFNYKKLFTNLMARKNSNNKIFDLILGPFTESNIDNNLSNIRKFGFKDSYIIRGE